MMRLQELAAVLGGELRHDDAGFSGVVIDSRAVSAGDLFVALRGERHDAHGFVDQARAAGAAAALVDHFVDCDLPQLKVADTLAGLQQFAKAWRARFDIPVVGVTGSNGKTTTKQMLASIFAARGPVLATRGNLNNHIGVPLTLLGLNAAHQTAVIEMGANHLGEIAQLADFAAPDIGVVTQAGDAHLEGFGSRENVARGKGELFAALGADGVAVINADDRYAPLWRGLAQGTQVLGFGIEQQADVQAQQLEIDTAAGSIGTRFVLRTPTGKAGVRLPMPGRHNVMNALAAAACGVAAGLDADTIAAGLQHVEAAQGRLSLRAGARGARLIDDSYNANPTSLRAGLELLAAMPGQRWAVLGDMAELGADTVELHRTAGRTARALGIDHLFSLGTLAAEAASAFGAGGESFESVDALVAALAPRLDADTVVLVKGSRSARMERVVAALAGQSFGGAH